MKNNKIPTHKLHNHISYSDDKNMVKILLNDDLDKFNEYIETNDIMDNFIFWCSNFKSRCNINLMECVLKFNCGKIARHLEKKNKINIYCMMIILSKFTKKKENENENENEKENKNQIETYNTAKKLFIDFLSCIKFDDNEADIIFNKLIDKKEWELVKLLHGNGYMIKNYTSILSKLPIEILHDILKYEYGYELNNDLKVNIITNSKINIDTLNNLMKDLNDINLIKNKEYNNKLFKVYGLYDIDFIKEFEKLGYVPDKQCLNYAFEKFNFDAIYHLLDKGFILQEKHIYGLFFVKYVSNKRIKNKNRNRNRYRTRFARMKSIISKANRIKKINNYDDKILEFLGKFYNDSNKMIFDRVIIKIMDCLLIAKCYKLLNYIKEKCNIDLKIRIDDIRYHVIKIIEDDCVDDLKKLFDLKILLPIDISTNPTYLSIALINGSQMLIEYFTEELSMCCTSIVVESNYKFKQIKNKIKFIQNLEKIGYPITNNIIQMCYVNGSLELIKYLHEKKYKIPSGLFGLIDILINKKNIINQVIKYGYKFNKKNLIDRFINSVLNVKWYFANTEKINIKNLSFLIKIGGTASSKSANYLAEYGLFKELFYLYDKFNIKPDKKCIIDFLSFDFFKKRFNKEYDIKTFEFIENEMKIDIFKDIDDHSKEKIIQNFMKTNSKLLDYIVNKINYKLSINDMIDYFNHMIGHNLNIVKYFESFGIVPTNDILLKSISLNLNNNNIANYFIEKYKFDITIKDAHELIYHNDDITIDKLKYFTKLGIKFTPYSIMLIINKRTTKHLSVIKHLIDEVGKITQKIYNLLNKYSWIDINKYEIVEYEPTNDEIIIDNDYDGDNDMGNERDYLDDVLNDVLNDVLVDLNDDNKSLSDESIDSDIDL